MEVSECFLSFFYIVYSVCFFLYIIRFCLTYLFFLFLQKALCAREYGKPAVSNIDIHTLLKDGMLVSVDGNTGIVKIMNEEEEK